MNRVALLLFLLPLTLLAAPEWQSTLSPAAPGNFPLPRELKARYRFGWSGIYAGYADVSFTKSHRDTLQFDASGGTTGFVRTLWKIDATHKAVAQASDLRPLKMKQVEAYGWKTITTSLEFSDEAVHGTRAVTISGSNSIEERKFPFPNINDLLTALLYVRSQPLQTGETYKIVVFPANTPYFVTIRSFGKETIHIKAGRFNALKFDIHVQKINAELNLEPQKRIKRATAWLSDDPDRILLRADAEIFVGHVWAELQNINFTEPQSPEHTER